MLQSPDSFQFNAPLRRHVGLLSTYPPKLCGLATFAAALEAALVKAGHRVDMVRIDDGDFIAGQARPVAGVLRNGVPASLRAAVEILSQGDVAIVQHEYGIFGGADGDEVLEILGALTVPSIVVLHTVPSQPTVRQRSVLAAIGLLGDRLVVMSEAAGKRLVDTYPIDPAKVVTIPHGASPVGDRVEVIGRSAATAPQLLTWGLLGPGKGIEHAIDAVALLGDVRPRVRYTVAGVTHPKVLARDGDRYRRSLQQRARAMGVGGTVRFDDTYRGLAELTRFVASATVVVLPYDSRDQATSGVLVDARAAGRPVIATAFPHAVDLLASGAGLVVPHGDPAALATAIRATVTDGDLLESMSAAARRLAPTLSWTAVAGQYAALADDLVMLADAMAI